MAITHKLVRISNIKFAEGNTVIAAQGEILQDLGADYTEREVWLAYQKHNRQDEHDFYLICKFEGEQYLDVVQVLFDFGEEEGDPFLDQADPSKRYFAQVAFGA
ncbi:MAG: hypothetical protein MJ157_02280 [Clostridia bacterium]|nr:hypothetical protein [Clostridia bacterium]